MEEIGEGEHASSQGKEDTMIEDEQSTSMERATGGTTYRHAADDRSRVATPNDSSADFDDGKRPAVRLTSEPQGDSISSAEIEARGNEQGEERGDSSELGQGGDFETKDGVVRRVGHDRIDLDHLSDNNGVSNSSQHREETGMSGHDDVRKSIGSEADSTGDRDIRRLDHGPGASSPTPSSSSAVDSNERCSSTEDNPRERFSSNARSRREKVRGGGSAGERNGDANREVLGGVRGGVHGANMVNGSNTGNARGDREHPGNANTKNAAEGIDGDAENNGIANVGSSGIQGRGKTNVDDVNVGVFCREDKVDSSSRQNPARPSLEEKGVEAAVKRQLRGGDVADGVIGFKGISTKRNNESIRSNINNGSDTNGVSDTTNKNCRDVRHLDDGRATTDAVYARSQNRLNSGGGQGAVIGVATSDHARALGAFDFDQRVGAVDHRQPDGSSSALGEHHTSEGSSLVPDAVNRREGDAAGLVTSSHGYGAAGRAADLEEKEDDHDLQSPHQAMDRWTSSVNGGERDGVTGDVTGGVPGNDGVFFVKPEERSLQDDGSSTVSSISSGQWNPSSVKNRRARNPGAEMEQARENGVKARAVGSGGPERRKRTSVVSGTGGNSHGVPAANKSSVYRRQVSPTMS